MISRDSLGLDGEFERLLYDGVAVYVNKGVIPKPSAYWDILDGIRIEEIDKYLVGIDDSEYRTYIVFGFDGSDIESIYNGGYIVVRDTDLSGDYDHISFIVVHKFGKIIINFNGKRIAYTYNKNRELPPDKVEWMLSQP